MDQLALLAYLMLGTVIAVGVAERVHLPFPVLATLLGMVFVPIPFVPEPGIPAGLILPLVLPPLLYAVAGRTSWQQVRSQARPILLLAVALVFITVFAVTVVARAIIPGLPVALAIALGAIVAPPDPVAAVAVAGPLRMPRRLVAILEGEGLFNDVTAIVIYEVAVSAAVAGSGISYGHAALLIVYSAVLAVVVGVGGGIVTRLLSTWIGNEPAHNSLTLVAPFGVYVVADRLHASGVLAVVVLALYLKQYGTDEANVSARLSGTAFWDVIELLVTGLGFALIGLELRKVTDPLGGQLWSATRDAVVICAVIIGIRAAWLFPATWLARLRRRRLMTVSETEELNASTPVGWRETLVMSWSGMRGVVTLATALALPDAMNNGTPLPERYRLIYIAFIVILVTLVLQGLTLPWLVRRLGVRAREDATVHAERLLAVRAARAALKRLDEIEEREDLSEEMVERLRRSRRDTVALISPDAYEDEAEDTVARARRRRKQAQRLAELEAELLAASRREVLAARSEPGTDPEVADAVLRRLDLRSLHGGGTHHD